MSCYHTTTLSYTGLYVLSAVTRTLSAITQKKEKQQQTGRHDKSTLMAKGLQNANSYCN